MTHFPGLDEQYHTWDHTTPGSEEQVTKRWGECPKPLLACTSIHSPGPCPQLSFFLDMSGLGPGHSTGKLLPSMSFRHLSLALRWEQAAPQVGVREEVSKRKLRPPVYTSNFLPTRNRKSVCRTSWIWFSFTKLNRASHYWLHSTTVSLLNNHIVCFLKNFH